MATAIPNHRRTGRDMTDLAEMNDPELAPTQWTVERIDAVT
jgi:hypothetical protein